MAAEVVTENFPGWLLYYKAPVQKIPTTTTTTTNPRPPMFFVFSGIPDVPRLFLFCNNLWNVQ